LKVSRGGRRLFARPASHSRCVATRPAFLHGYKRFVMRILTGKIWSVLVALIAGCAVGPDYQPPERDDMTAEAFGVRDSALLTPAEVDIAWWQALDVKQLNALIQRAAAHNHDLRIARANVLAARSLLIQGGLDLAPIITADGAVTRRKVSAGSGSTFDKRTTTYDAGFDMNWELDFFGRVRRSVQALAADYQSLLADQRSTFVTVAAEVARSYIDLRGAQYRLDVARRNAENQRRTYQLTQALRDGGRGTELDVVQARAQLDSTRASIPPLRAQVERAVHRLSVLVGQPPRALESDLADPRPLPELPETVRVGDPAALLRRRPDVAAAERRLAAETARVGVAVADLFPRVTLLGSAGFLTTEADEFGERPSQVWDLAPTVSWPAFDLGRVLTRIDVAEAETQAALAAYEQTALTALEETENAMVEYIQARAREERLQAASQSSARAAELARVRYRSGMENFLTVLDAERRLLEAQDALAVARTESATALIALYKALGGGWQAAFPSRQE